MRTSGALLMPSNYAANVEKQVQDRDGNWLDADDEATFPTFHMGETVNYRIVVTNAGPGTLTNLVITDALIPAGSFSILTLAAGEESIHTFSAVVDDALVAAAGGLTVVNLAVTTIDTPVDVPTAPVVPEDPAGINVVAYATEKAANTAGPVMVGDIVEYTVTITPTGEVAVPDAEFVDNLAGVLNRADWNDTLVASNGTATFDPATQTLSWTGDVEPGTPVTVTYSVLVKLAEATELVNTVASPGCDPVDPVCDVTIPVTPETYAAELVKLVQDADGNWLDANDAATYPAFRIGDEVNYRIEVTNTGSDTLNNVVVTDDLFPAGSFTIASLAPGAVETHEFTVTIEADTDLVVVNTASAVTDKPVDVPTAPVINDDPAGITVTTYAVVKKASAGEVKMGEKVTYTVTITPVGTKAVPEAPIVDDLSKVLTQGTIDNVSATSGDVVYDEAAQQLTWTGALTPGEPITITYELTTTKTGDAINTVTSPGCETTADCTTTTSVVPAPPAPPLPKTGGEAGPSAIALIAGLLMAGAAVTSRKAVRNQ